MEAQMPDPIPQPPEFPVQDPPPDDRPPMEVPPDSDPLPNPAPLRMMVSAHSVIAVAKCAEKVEQKLTLLRH